MVYMQHMGGIWRMSKKQRRRLFTDLARGAEVNLDDYGKLIISQFENFEDLLETAEEVIEGEHT